MSDNNNTSNIAAEMSLKLAQLEGAFLFLDEMNNNSNRPRNITEQNTVTRNLRRIREVRELYKIITRDTPSVNVPGVEISRMAAQQFLHDS